MYTWLPLYIVQEAFLLHNDHRNQCSIPVVKNWPRYRWNRTNWKHPNHYLFSRTPSWWWCSRSVGNPHLFRRIQIWTQVWIEEIFMNVWKIQIRTTSRVSRFYRWEAMIRQLAHCRCIHLEWIHLDIQGCGILRHTCILQSTPLLVSRNACGEKTIWLNCFVRFVFRGPEFSFSIKPSSLSVPPKYTSVYRIHQIFSKFCPKIV